VVDVARDRLRRFVAVRARRRLRRLAVGAALLVAVPACNWPQYLAGPQHTGYNAGEATLGRGNVRELRVAWTTSFPIDTGQFAPAVVDGNVYVKGGVLDAATGTPVPGSAVVPGLHPAVGHDVVIGCQSLFGATAVDRTTGATRWSVPDANCAGAGTTLAGGISYIPVGSGSEMQLGAYRVAGGQQVWRRKPCPTGETYLGMATVGRGLAFLPCFAGMGVQGHTLVAVDAAAGRTRWSRKLDMPTFSAVPVVAGDRVFAVGGGDGTTGEEDSEVFALDVRTGAQLWRTTIDEFVGLGAPATDGQLLYLLDTSGTLRALDPATGEIEWTNFTDVPGHNGQAVVANGVVYTASFDGTVEAFDTRDGRRLFTTELGVTVHGAAPVVAGGTLYIQTSDNMLVALRPPVVSAG
jgi:outer membrane protein assembly factor BamB